MSQDPGCGTSSTFKYDLCSEQVRTELGVPNLKWLLNTRDDCYYHYRSLSEESVLVQAASVDAKLAIVFTDFLVQATGTDHCNH